MFLKVNSVRPLEAYRLEIGFSDGRVKEVNLKGELQGEVFEPLQNPTLFEQVYVDAETGTIAWPNGADFAPEFLYEIGSEVKEAA